MAVIMGLHNKKSIDSRQNGQLHTRTPESGGPPLYWIVVGTILALWAIVFIITTVCIIRRVKARCKERQVAVEPSTVTQARQA